MRQNSDLLITPEHTNASSCLQSFIDTLLILLDAFAECRAHVLWWVGDDINLSPKFLLELIGEFESVPNVMVLPQTRRKSISLSGVCSPRANEPNKYASLTSY